MAQVSVKYLTAGGNRHPSAADWDPASGIVAFGSDRNVALWRPLVLIIYIIRINATRVLIM